MIHLQKLLLGLALWATVTGSYAQESYAFLAEDAHFQRGMELLDKQQFSEAQECFRKTLETPGNENTLLHAEAQFQIAYCAVRLFHADAEHYTWQFIADNPDHRRVNEARLNLGGYFYATKQWPQAIDWYKQVADGQLTKDEISELYFKLGYAYFSTEQYALAKPAFYRVKDIDARYTAPAIYYYSHIHYQEGNDQTALNGFLRLTTDNTFGAIVPYYIVQTYYKQHRYQDIVSFIPGSINKVTPKRMAEVSRITAEAYSQLGRYEEALPYFQTFLDSAASISSDDRYQAGYAYYKAQKYETAVEILSSISNEDSKLGQNAAYYLADCYIRLQDKPNARKAFYTASRADYDPAIKQDALFNYALISFELGSDPFNETILAFEEFIRLYPESKRLDEVYRFMVQAYLNARNYKAALASIEKAGLQSDEFKQAYQKIALFRGIELFNNLQFAEAEALFNKSLSYGVYDQVLSARAWFWSAEAQYRQKKYPAAVESYLQFEKTPVAFTLNEYDRLNYCLGYACFKQKKYQEGIAYFRKFTTNTPDALKAEQTDALIRIGDSYYALTDYYSASDFYHRAASASDYSMLQEAICTGLQNKDIQKIQILKELLAQFPNSSYYDDALYEMAQSYLKIQSNQQAMEHLKELVTRFPQSPYAASSSVQLGLLYYNADAPDQAQQWFKTTIASYPGSSAARDALRGLKNLSVDINQVDDYVTYANSLGSQAPVITVNEQDSLTYTSAEKKYMAGNCLESSQAFEKYIANFSTGNYLLNANFYLGDCNYQAKNFDKALQAFQYILSRPRNMYTEQALLGAARIEITRKNYTKAIEHYTQLAEQFASPGNTKEAGMALMRSHYALNQYVQALQWGNQVVQMAKLSPEDLRQAQYIIARSYQETGKMDEALDRYRMLSSEVMSSEGAEARFRMAELNYQKGQPAEAEKIILAFSELPTPHEYWIARSFILWSEIFSERKEYFQALQTLESIIEYYQTPDDGILDLAKKTKARIESLQKAEQPAAAPADVEINMD